MSKSVTHTIDNIDVSLRAQAAAIFVAAVAEVLQHRVGDAIPTEGTGIARSMHVTILQEFAAQFTQAVKKEQAEVIARRRALSEAVGEMLDAGAERFGLPKRGAGEIDQDYRNRSISELGFHGMPIRDALNNLADEVVKLTEMPGLLKELLDSTIAKL